jgi:hypothetical protein
MKSFLILAVSESARAVVETKLILAALPNERRLTSTFRMRLRRNGGNLLTAELGR